MLDINVKDVSLVLEGGTFRTVFTMGILDAFLDEGIMMPHISGVSAGITYAGSYISQQKGRNIQILKKYRHDNTVHPSLLPERAAGLHKLPATFGSSYPSSNHPYS